MRWWLDDSATLEVDLADGRPPSREEVTRALSELRVLLDTTPVRSVVVNGEPVGPRRGRATYHELEAPIRYEAAMRRLRSGRGFDRRARPGPST